LFLAAVERLKAPFSGADVTHVVGIESRGFWFGAALAERLGAGFVPARKPGKLPAATLREEYALEYGTDALEVHADALHAGARGPGALGRAGGGGRGGGGAAGGPGGGLRRPRAAGGGRSGAGRRAGRAGRGRRASWSVVRGAWSVVRGPWSVVNGYSGEVP